jgi:hypothetical protein
MFNNWKIAKFSIVDPFLSQIEVSPDTLPANGTSQGVITISPKNNSDTLLASGKQGVLSNTGAGSLSNVIDLGDGNYEATVTAPVAIGADTVSAIVISGIDTISIFWKAIVTYVNPTTINENPISPKRFYLYQNSPNPFNPTTIIKYQIPKTSFVSLKVYDILGNEVATLVNEERAAGMYKVEFTPASGNRELVSGIYFYKLTVGNFVETKKMVFLK